MPIHDWTRVQAGTFHHFHHSWIEEIARALNRGLLPHDYYAMSEPITGSLGPELLALNLPVHGSLRAEALPSSGGVVVAFAPPNVRFHARTEVDLPHAGGIRPPPLGRHLPLGLGGRPRVLARRPLRAAS